jgi:predicted DNA-binding transcriptional regulator AlpA
MRNKPNTQTSPCERRFGRGSERELQTRRSPTDTVQRRGDRGSGDDDEAASRRFLTGPAVCERYHISDMSLWRWLKDATLNFPQPALLVRGRRYWAEGDNHLS